jgi:hypothetical protein
MLTHMAVRSTLVALPAFGLAIGFALSLRGKRRGRAGPGLRSQCEIVSSLGPCEVGPDRRPAFDDTGADRRTITRPSFAHPLVSWLMAWSSSARTSLITIL